MNGGTILDEVVIELRDREREHFLPIYIEIAKTSLSKKWLISLNDILSRGLHLEKNYCFLGFAQGPRDGRMILDAVNQSIDAINKSTLGYKIDDFFTLDNCLGAGPVGENLPGLKIVEDRLNGLHRYFEDLQGVSGHPSPYILNASASDKWHIRQLNLLCHEFESWALSNRKLQYAPEWQRPSQLMCWINAPRFFLDKEDYELFGIDTLNRATGGVFVGVNKAVGKHHYEVYKDEGRSVDELITTTLRSQTEAAGDFDIEWGVDPRNRPWQQQDHQNFRQWLLDNGFDPNDKSLTIGHPQIGQVDLKRSFGTDQPEKVWDLLNSHLDVWSVRTSEQQAIYDYHWSDADFIDIQINCIERNTNV